MADSSIQLETAARSDSSEDEQVEDEHVEDSQVHGVMVLTLLDKIIGAVDQIQQTQNSLEHRQQEMESSVTGIQSELTKLTKSHTTTSNTVNKMLEKVRKVSVNVKTVRQHLEKQAGQIKRLETNEAELLKRRNFKVMIYQVRETKPEGTVSPHRATADPTGQASSELRADTSRAGLCPPEAGSSLTSALEFLGVEEEAGSVEGSEDAHWTFSSPELFCLLIKVDEVKLPSKVSVSKSLKELEKVAEEGEEDSQHGKDHEDEEQEQLQLSSDEEVEIEEIIEESRAERIKRSGMRRVDDIKKAFSKEKMEKTKLKTKENLEKTKLKTKENLEKTKLKTKENLEKTKHNIEKKMSKLGTRIVNTERKEKMKISSEKVKKSFTPNHTVYARSKTTIYRVPPFTFHVKKIRDGEVEEVMGTEMMEVGGEEDGEIQELLMEEHSPEVQALLELAEETDTFLAEKRDRERDSD
ncbi:polymerase I and transcript release factor [Acipenser ruthenus]|uniref:Polymerase I and transcript release factor n=1 Tax=Acipenser ruthenus TaxID=7906 RepID=A0A444UK57_ACIRT|nr:polymerase I and transcript release factor [Acipenser ruthenus]